MTLDYAKQLLAGLADGVNPLTGEILPENCICNQPEIIRAFYCILKEFTVKTKEPKAENTGKPWSAEDDAMLAKMFDSGCSRKEMQERFKRSDGALAARLVRLGKIQDRSELRRNK